VGLVLVVLKLQVLLAELISKTHLMEQEDGVASEMCGFGISGADILSLSIRVGKVNLRKTGKWNWTRAVCLALVIIKLQVLLPKS